MVSSDFGQLAVSRHLTSGVDWAMAGAASAETAMPAAPTLRSSRRFMDMFPPYSKARAEISPPWRSGLRRHSHVLRLDMTLDAACASGKPRHTRSPAVPEECPERTDWCTAKGWAHHQPPLMCSAFLNPIAAVPEPQAREDLINRGASNLSMRQ